MIRRRWMTGILLVALTATLSACTATAPRSGQSDAEGHPDQPRPTAPPLPPLTVLDASYPAAGVSVPGLRGQRILNSAGISARWADLPGAKEFNRKLAEVVKQQIEALTAELGTDYTPEAPPAPAGLSDRGCVPGSTFRSAEQIVSDPDLAPPGTALTIVCDPVLAAGPHFGERLRFIRSHGGQVTSDTVETLYTETGTDRVAREAELLDAERLPDLYQQAEKLAAPIGQLTGALTPPEGAPLLRDHVSAIQFGPDGSLLLTVDQGFFAAHPRREDAPPPTPFSLRLSPQLAQKYLTDLGRAIASSIAQPWAGTPQVNAGQAFVDCDLVPCLALTFDDGPSSNTPQLLQDLAAHDSAATFFLIGKNVAALPQVVADEVAAGHQLGNHTWGHPSLTKLPLEAASKEIADTTAAIVSASGVSPALVRPPYGDWNQVLQERIQLPFVLWDIDTQDWREPPEEDLIRSAATDPDPGDIVLMHDIHATTTAAIPKILAQLRDRGFTLVTIDQLFDGAVPEVAYSR